ncbi:hypothetical protein LCGC14_0810220 [marine sediment metagenome]|uniref:Uncharacterized protein n=1 Tax=marine sediment metagenome TaxID=412755 RepID=A0A0F9SUF8_9ZZZZ
MSNKPANEWLCPEHLAPKQEDVQNRQIELKKLHEEMKIKAQELQLKNSELWNEIRESISGLGSEHERAIYNACHLRYDPSSKKIQAFGKGSCPLCDEEAKDAIKNMAAGHGGGILVTGSSKKGSSVSPPPAADVSGDILREKRRGRRGLFPDDEGAVN